MVTQAGSSHQKWDALPSRGEIHLRRISSFFLMGMLLMVITPFAPFSWPFPSHGPELLDNFLSPPLVLGALYAQWRIASVVAPLTVELSDYVFVYKQSMYWQFAFCEFLVCVGIYVAKNEYLRRLGSVGLVGGLWMLGWKATPESVKREAWVHLKWLWTMMAFNEARRVTSGRRRW